LLRGRDGLGEPKDVNAESWISDNDDGDPADLVLHVHRLVFPSSRVIGSCPGVRATTNNAASFRRPPLFFAGEFKGRFVVGVADYSMTKSTMLPELPPMDTSIETMARPSTVASTMKESLTMTIAVGQVYTAGSVNSVKLAKRSLR